MSGLITRNITNSLEIQAFFDNLAEQYKESHGTEDQLLKQRLTLIKTLLGPANGVLLEIGCGTCIHLFNLTASFDKVIGTDISPKMIEVAKNKRNKHPEQQKIILNVDAAEHLLTLTDNSINSVLCVGTLEHIPNKQMALQQIKRVLKPQGIFICLTLNAKYYWYHLADWFKLDTKHLSTDSFVSQQELSDRLIKLGFFIEQIGYWRFIPKGDMPRGTHLIFEILEICGRLYNIKNFRGGLYIRAVHHKTG